MPAVPSFITEPVCEQFRALCGNGRCRTPRVGIDAIDDRVLFDQLVQVLVFGCVYEPDPEQTVSATTLRRRRDEWIDLGVMAAMEQLVLHVHHRLIGLELGDIAVDGRITKALRGAELARPSPVDQGKQGIKRSCAVCTGARVTSFVTRNGVNPRGFRHHP